MSLKKTVCVDLDGVLAEYDRWRGIDHIGDPIPGAVEFMAALAEIAYVTVYTTRCNPVVNHRNSQDELTQRVEQWLCRYGIKYNEIDTGPGKPIAAAYIDDRAVICRPMRDDVYDYDRALAETRALLKGEPLGGTGGFPDGKLNEEDEGEMRLAISSTENGDVRLDFGKPIAWVGFPREAAIELASTILKHASK